MVYILELERPLSGRARFYIGYARDEFSYARRMKDHRKGRGAAFTRAAKAQGISWKTVVIVPEATRADERRWKNWHRPYAVVRALKNKGYGAFL